MTSSDDSFDWTRYESEVVDLARPRAGGERRSRYA
jgi:hypothetical protein